jgi:predicted CxxxxCH...CXXCH cytochrome family protein
LSHSNDNAGQKWGNYWTTQKDACLYCHGNSKHNTSGLGKALIAIGSDQIGSAIGSGTLCSSCHNSGDSNYTAIMSLLIPDPVANVAGSNYNSSGINHASYGVTDADCLPCHGSALSVSPTISEFPHNVASATGCTACHGQPPSGAIRNNTDGAHTLHMTAGYGNVPETSCNYCHSNGGINDNNGAKHPNNIYNVSFNVSVLTYTLNVTSGSDDTCAGVSCHTNGLSPGAKAGTSIWNGSTAGRCNVCHSTATSGMPSTGNHSTKHYNASRGFECATCHGTNADTGGQSGHKTNQIIDVAFTGLAAPGTFNSGTKTCNAYCHSPNSYDAKPVPTWGTTLGACGTNCHSKPPAMTRLGSTNAQHTGLTGSSDCEGCHGPGANTGTQDGHVNRVVDGSGASCIGCHGTVGVSLGLHSNLSGTSAVEDSDCQTCHFRAGDITMTNPAGIGDANSSNTYYCEDCHTTAGRRSVKSTILKDGTSHGSADCKWCHAAGDQPAFKYHAIGPIGTATGTNCVTCHYNANLVDEPFKAPGEIHSENIDDGEHGCYDCHYPNADNHAVTALNDFSSPTVSISVSTPVTSGTPALVQATIFDGYMQIAAAQYRVTNSSGEIIPWTNMTPSGGRFGSNNQGVYSNIATSGMKGTYTVYVKGMASAYKTNPSLPYYPLNGLWSAEYGTQLIVTQPKGYVNGTVKNNSVNIQGATVTTNTGVTAITDANGFYSLNLVNGTYQLTTIKNLEYYTNSSVSVTVTAPATYTKDIILNKKPIGTISGTVRLK